MDDSSLFVLHSTEQGFQRNLVLIHFYRFVVFRQSNIAEILTPAHFSIYLSRGRVRQWLLFTLAQLGRRKPRTNRPQERKRKYKKKENLSISKYVYFARYKIKLQKIKIYIDTKTTFEKKSYILIQNVLYFINKSV